MPTVLSRFLFRPTIWIVFAIALAIVDLFAPAQLAVYVLALALLPLAWRWVHRRHIALLMSVLLIAVATPGVLLAVRHTLSPPPGGTTSGPQPSWPVEPARLWTLAALLAAGQFHANLQRARRRRLALRRELQRRVRRRTNQVRRANRALRNEVALRQETEHLLDRSENRFKALMDRMQLQVTRKNPDGVFIYANETFCRNLGIAVADVIGRTDADLFPDELASAYRADDLHVMSSGRAVDQVEEHPSLDGKPGFVQVFKAPEYDQDGRCVGVQLIFWDITQKHHAEIALRDSEARKRALFEASGDAMLLVDAEGHVVEANRSASGLFHMTVEELVGRRLEEIAVPAWGPAPATDTIAESEAGDEASTPIRWEDLPQSSRYELKLARADGSSFQGEVSVHSIPVNHAEGMAIIVRDVTLQRRAFETLQKAKAAAEAANRTKLEFMAGVSHELRTPLGGITGIAELLSNSPLSDRNRQYIDLIRHNAALLSDLIEDILDFAAIEAGRLQIAAAPTDLHQLVGEAFQCLSSRAAEKPLRMILAIDPRTPRAVIADAKRIRQIIINLAGNAVKFTPRGEIRMRLTPEPIAAIRDGKAVPIVIEVTDTGIGIAPEKQRQVFEAFERGESGTTRVYGGTGLGLAISRKLAQRMGGDIELESRLGQGSTFRCRLLLSLASPSEAAPEGSRPHPDRASPAILLDTGNAAMDEAFAESLRYDGWSCRRAPQAEDSGAAPRGWWIISAETAVRRLQSRRPADWVIWVTRLGDERPPLAAEHDVVLIEPVVPDELRRVVREGPRSSAHPAADAAERRGRNDRGRRPDEAPVLLVDDSDVNRLVFHDVLEREGVVVEVARCGDEALEMIAGKLDLESENGRPGSTSAKIYGCILMDLEMPGMDGTEASRRIRQLYRERGAEAPPIVALTAHVTDEHRRLCLEAGMDGFLTKPIASDRLLTEVRRRLGLPRRLEGAMAGIGHAGHHPAPEPDGSTESRSAPGLSGPPSRPADLSTGAASMNDPQLPPDSRSEPEPHNIPNPDEEPGWRERMASHGGGDEATVISLCDAFLAEVPELVKRVRQAVRQQDAKRLRTAAHTLKSCLRYVAGEEDVALAASVEEASADPSAISDDQLQALERVSRRWTERVDLLAAELRGGTDASRSE